MQVCLRSNYTLLYHFCHRNNRLLLLIDNMKRNMYGIGGKTRPCNSLEHNENTSFKPSPYSILLILCTPNCHIPFLVVRISKLLSYKHLHIHFKYYPQQDCFYEVRACSLSSSYNIFTSSKKELERQETQ